MSCNCGNPWHYGWSADFLQPADPCPGGPECVDKISTDCVIYTGPDLPCLGITTDMTLTEILHILYEGIYPNCFTTTTTSTTSTTTTTTVPVISCGESSTYTGEQRYPISQAVTLGSDIGNVFYSFDVYSVPDRFIVGWNGNVVIDTGYRGVLSYDFGGLDRATFNASLTGKVDPITLTTYPDLVNFPDDGYPRVSTPTAGTLFFNKSVAFPTFATVDVYAPLPGTAWEYTMSCPGITTTTTS